MRSNWWADVVEPAFVGLTEGIWVAVLYLLFEVVGGTPVALGPLAFVIVTSLAALVSPRLDRFGSARWQIVSLGAIVVGVVGTLLGPGALAALASGGPGGRLRRPSRAAGCSAWPSSGAWSRRDRSTIPTGRAGRSSGASSS